MFLSCFFFFFPLPSFYNSSYFILLERRVGVGFTELFFASTASLKNLKIDGKLFQDVSSWRSVPARYKGDSLTGGRLAAAGPARRGVDAKPGEAIQPLAAGPGGARGRGGGCRGCPAAELGGSWAGTTVHTHTDTQTHVHVHGHTDERS